ncbi:MAG: hypothetical protein LQ346_008675, partial [Caloplaca aetnensis]
MPHTTRASCTLTLLLILAVSTPSLASPFNNAIPNLAAIDLYSHHLPPSPRLPTVAAAALRPRSTNMPPIFSALNATHVALLRSYHFHPAPPTPSSPLHAFFDAARALANDGALAKQVLHESVGYTYGLLKMQIVGAVRLTWEAVQLVLRFLEEFVSGVPMFFEVALEIA